MRREVLLALWKIHVLYHAAQRPVYGQWIAAELRKHGYQISPGTLYPLLRRMERLRWLERIESVSNNSTKARQEYVLTPRGAEIVEVFKDAIAELYKELTEEPEQSRPSETRNDLLGAPAW